MVADFACLFQNVPKSARGGNLPNQPNLLFQNAPWESPKVRLGRSRNDAWEGLKTTLDWCVGLSLGWLWVCQA